ncbi:sigma-54-dependent Fis family transcriptional regulator [Tistrella sp. BH-R2-4]|jgi:transcriptional regulator of acetoin/glycerol metabolism|uniref:Sigma-54-dependent Fis family transcriptional regulator n=1 Tax=Tistrella arctica TaxID=3133430 RepID=A0ABU9YSU5_9PROT
MSAHDHIDEIDRVLGGDASLRDAVVLQSWRRCVTDHGLDPARPNPAYIVPDTKLREHREQSERLIAIARSGLEALFRQVAGQSYVLLLADAQGVTVDFFGDPAFERDLRQAGLYLGSDWSENLAGTCGVGACIATGEAVTIHQTDHFDLTHTPLSCTAAPIFSTTGALAAVLDISLLRSPQPKVSQSLALQLVKTSARRIELANLMAMNRLEWVLRFSTLPEFLEVDPEAAIALDSAGCVIGMTHAAARVLAQAGGTLWQRPDTLIGQKLQRFFDLSIDDLPTLTRARPAQDRVVRLRDGRAMFAHAIMPQRSATALIAARTTLPKPLSALSGDDAVMRAVEKTAARLAAGTMPVLIRGETGAGKQSLARAIHDSRPGSGPFVAVDCAAIDEDAIRAAQGGTLYLDEIADLSEAAQARLVRMLTDDGVAVGAGRQPVRLRLRIISATSADPEAMVSGGRFRRDLFFRLAGASLTLPPLRARQDIDWLIDRMLRQRAITYPHHYRLSAAARMELKQRPWPGNIRELINTLDVALAMTDGAVIDLEDLPPPVLPVADPVAADARTMPEAADELETTLRICGWNVARAARRLGVDRTTVHRRMERLGIHRPGTPSPA